MEKSNNLHLKYIFGIAFAIAGFFLVLGFSHFIGTKISPATTFWLSRLFIWILLGIIFTYAWQVEKNKFLLIKESWKKWWFYPLGVIALITVVYIFILLAGLAELWIGYHGDNSAEQKMSKLLCSHKILLVFTCITAAVTEESLFRGYILARLKKITGSDWIAVVGSALLFGLAHFGYYNLNNMLFPFIIGLVFGTFYIKYKSLATLMLCHLTIDLYSLLSSCS